MFDLLRVDAMNGSSCLSVLDRLLAVACVSTTFPHCTVLPIDSQEESGFISGACQSQLFISSILRCRFGLLVGLGGAAAAYTDHHKGHLSKLELGLSEEKSSTTRRRVGGTQQQ